MRIGDPHSRSDGRRVAAATIVGTAIEWYDFYLYASMASLVFGRVFFDSTDPRTATLAAVATFGAGFLARPFGGMVFGVLGDRLGRKFTLVATFLLMGISTGIIGLLPSYEAAGVTGTILLVVVRVFQGLGAGAEYAAATVTSVEHAGPAKRGSRGAWPALGMSIGLGLSSVTMFVLSAVGEDFLIGGGWRIPFLASFVLVGVGLWVRSRVPETPEFLQLRSERPAAVRRSSLRVVLRRDWRGLATVTVVALGSNAVSYTFKTFSIAYVADYQGVDTRSSTLALSVAALVSIAAVPVVGWLCDRYCAGTVFAVTGVLSGLFAFPFLALLQDASEVALMTAMLIGTGFLVPALLGSQGAFYAAQFPVDTRTTGVGTGREVGGSISGALAPLGALALVAASPTNSTVGVGIVIVAASVCIAVFSLLRRTGVQERRPAAEPTPVLAHPTA